MICMDKEYIYKNYLSTQFKKAHGNIEEGFNLYYNYYKKNYQKHLPNDKNSKILDIGCGAGHFLYFLEEENYLNYLGIDISNENIKFCKSKGFKVKLYNVFDFFENDKSYFDLIVMNDVIEHFTKEEVTRLLNSINGHLVDGGKLIIKVVNSSNPILSSSSRYMDFTHEVGFTEESLTQILLVSDFKFVKILPQDIYVLYWNPLNYIAKLFSYFLNTTFLLLFRLYGRKSTKIFTKDIIAVALK